MAAVKKNGKVQSVNYGVVCASCFNHVLLSLNSLLCELASFCLTNNSFSTIYTSGFLLNSFPSHVVGICHEKNPKGFLACFPSRDLTLKTSLNWPRDRFSKIVENFDEEQQMGIKFLYWRKIEFSLERWCVVHGNVASSVRMLSSYQVSIMVALRHHTVDSCAFFMDMCSMLTVSAYSAAVARKGRHLCLSQAKVLISKHKAKNKKHNIFFLSSPQRANTRHETDEHTVITLVSSNNQK